MDWHLEPRHKIQPGSGTWPSIVSLDHFVSSPYKVHLILSLFCCLFLVKWSFMMLLPPPILHFCVNETTWANEVVGREFQSGLSWIKVFDWRHKRFALGQMFILGLVFRWMGEFGSLCLGPTSMSMCAGVGDGMAAPSPVIFLPLQCCGHGFLRSSYGSWLRMLLDLCHFIFASVSCVQQSPFWGGFYQCSSNFWKGWRVSWLTCLFTFYFLSAFNNFVLNTSFHKRFGKSTQGKPLRSFVEIHPCCCVCD